MFCVRIIFPTLSCFQFHSLRRETRRSSEFNRTTKELTPGVAQYHQYSVNIFRWRNWYFITRYWERCEYYEIYKLGSILLAHTQFYQFLYIYIDFFFFLVMDRSHKLPVQMKFRSQFFINKIKDSCVDILYPYLSIFYLLQRTFRFLNNASHHALG